MNTTSRLRIEPLRESHAQAMFPLLQDDRIYRFIPDKRYGAVADLAGRYRRLEAGSPDPGEQWLNWCLFRHDDGRAIGTLQATISVRDRAAWIAYVLAPDVWGQGYATESVRWLLGYLEATGIVDVARAQVDGRNRASQAVVERLRFRRAADVMEDGNVDFVYELQLERLRQAEPMIEARPDVASRLADLKRAGATPVQALQAVHDEFGLSLAEAKDRLAQSTDWAAERAAAEVLHQQIVDALGGDRTD